MELSKELKISEKVEEALKLLPLNPGVYLMKSATDKIIYIGKAKNLKNRVKSYFNNSLSKNHLASQLLKSKVKDLEWIITDTEMEALILEANLVRKHSPYYNILLKDDKHFPYVVITTSEAFPQIKVTRKVKKDGDVYFGPYTDVKAMRKTIKMIYKVFRIRDCKLELPLKNLIKPCLTYHIGRCDAPCADFCTEKEYGVLVKEAVLLLGGKSHELESSLEGEMKKYSGDLNFEEAGRIRDQLRFLETTRQRQKMDLGEPQVSKDLIAVARTGKVGCAVVLQIREGVVIDRKRYELHCELEESESEMITQFCKSFYKRGEDIPKEIILSHAFNSDENLEELLKLLRGGAFRAETPQKGDKKKQVNLAYYNAKVHVAEYIAQREKRVRQNFSVLALKEDLNLDFIPRVIEAYDISHLSGTDTVASGVVFVDGKPRKRSYKKYNIKTVQGIDDFASMNEVLERRLKRRHEEGNELPDLLLIDGGKGQLSAACRALKKHGVEGQAIIGLAKRLEEVFFPGKSEALMIPKASASLKLIQQLRDEAHRFAITFQKSKRKKYLTQSWMDEVPGLGPKTKEKLLRAFQSPVKVKEQELEALQRVMGKVKGKSLFDWVRK